MNNIIYYNNALKRIYSSTKKRLELLESELKALPEGQLQIRERKGGFSCYLRSDGKRRSIPVKSKLAARLGRKMIAQQELLLLKLISSTMKKLLQETTRIESGYRGSGAISLGLIPKAFGAMNTRLCPEEMKWLSSIRTADNLRPDEKTHSTNCGIYVRSKSERDIANMLYLFGILFIYEPILIIDGETFCPDFIIRLPDGRIFIWEHFGRMDDPSYSSHALHKIESYKQVGFYQHTNLICTYEEDMHDLKIIERIIRERLCRI